MAYSRNIDNWDPMAENYHDANINSYERGPGVNLTPFARAPATNAEYKLYVRNIPLEISEMGVRNIFDRYGKTLGVMSPMESGWAFVTYGSFREAETAIRQLHQTEPLHLEVQFAKKKEKQTKPRNPVQVGIPDIEVIPRIGLPLDDQRRDYVSPEQCPLPNRATMRNPGRGKDLAGVARRVIAPSPGHPYHEHDDLLYPVMHDPNLYDPYEDAGPFPDTNNMWSRGRLQVAKDGTRYVTMGRGYTWYELPTPHPRINQQIRAVYENRESGLYEYGDNKLAQQIGKCQHCAQPATMRCQRCREFYCSRACQEDDWQRHKIECQSMPGLEGGVESASISLSSGEEAPKLPVKRSIRKMRRPLTAAAPLAGPNSTSTPVPATSPTHGMPAKTLEDIQIPVPLKPKEKENEPISTQDRLKRSRSGDQKGVFDQNKPANPGGWNPMKNNADYQPLRSSNNQGLNVNRRLNSSDGLPPPVLKEDNEAKKEPSKKGSREALSQGSSENRNLKSQNAAVPSAKNIETADQTNRNFFKRENNAQQQKGYQQVLTDQVKKLNVKDPETPKPVRKPISVDPDFGFYKPGDVPFTCDAKSSQKVSFQNEKSGDVAGTSGVPKKVENEMSKKTPDQTEVKTPVVKSAASVLLAKAKQQRKNVVELLDVEEEGCFEVHVLLGGNKAAVTVCVLKYQEEYAKILSELTPECDNLPKPMSFKPKVGEFVCGKRLDDWVRGTVASLGPPIRLTLVDEGRVEPVTDLKPVPQEFINLPTLGAICELTKGDFKLEPMAQYTFMVLNKNSNNIADDGLEIILVSADEKEGRGILKPWTPAPEQKGIPYATLTTGTEVQLASYRSHTLIFVRSLVPESLELFAKVTQEVARWSTQAQKLTEPPIDGEMVIAKFIDGNFYRAIVRKIHDKKITVSYLDYGNIETTTLENIRPICPKLKEYPSCAAKILLKDMPKDVPITKEASDYLCKLTAEEIPLMCTFEGSPAVDGVVLKLADGTSVNKKIVDLLTPSWKKEEDKTTVFMIGDLDVAELGPVGETVHVIVLFSYEPLLHAIAPHDIELIGHVEGVLTAQMQEYCEQLKENYIPRQSELCIAPYKGMWYRAVCLEPNCTPTTSSVNFVDFGNIEEIPHSQLRVMTKDFMTTKTLASICTVIGLGPVDENGELPAAVGARVIELLPSNTVTLAKIVECSKPGEYTVELPEIKKTLVKEGLIKM